MNDREISIECQHNYLHERNFIINFFNRTIHTTVTSTSSVVRDWLHALLHFHRYRRHKLVMGLGVQWRAPYGSSASIIQLCIGTRCLIFQLRHADNVPRILERVLADPSITFVGVRNDKDAGMLRNGRDHLEVSNLVDLRYVAAEERGLSTNLSMEGYAECVLGYGGIFKPNSVAMSNWDADWLSDDQVQYACVDAFVSFLLGVELEAWNWA